MCVCKCVCVCAFILLVVVLVSRSHHHQLTIGIAIQLCAVEASYLGKCFVPNDRVPTDEVLAEAKKSTGLVPTNDIKFGEDAVKFVLGNRSAETRVCLQPSTHPPLRPVPTLYHHQDTQTPTLPTLLP